MRERLTGNDKILLQALFELKFRLTVGIPSGDFKIYAVQLGLFS